MKRCLMVTGGPLDLSFGRRFLLGRTYDLVIAVDAGLAACEALGLCPDLLVGDFDTLGRERLLEYQERSGVRQTSISRKRMRRIRSWPSGTPWRPAVSLWICWEPREAAWIMSCPTSSSWPRGGKRASG